MDMDIELIRRFDDLLNAPYMMAYERPNRNGIERVFISCWTRPFKLCV